MRFFNILKKFFFSLISNTTCLLSSSMIRYQKNPPAGPEPEDLLDCKDLLNMLTYHYTVSVTNDSQRLIHRASVYSHLQEFKALHPQMSLSGFTNFLEWHYYANTIVNRELTLYYVTHLTEAATSYFSGG